MNFIEKIIASVINPKHAMQTIAEEPYIEEAVMIVGILAVLNALAAYFGIDKIIPISESIPASILPIFSIIFIMGALIFPFIGWIIGTGIIHMISMVLGGDGKFYPNLVTAAAYSMVPQIFGNIISLALLFMVESTTISMDIKSYILISNVIYLIMNIWAAAILIFGVQSVHKLNFQKSAIVVGIPSSINIILMLWGIWMSSTL